MNSPSSDGDDRSHRSTDSLTTFTYEDLRIFARRLLAIHGATDRDPTSIVHHAYLRLQRQDKRTWRDPNQFKAVAKTMLRRALIDELRAQGRRVHGLERLSRDAEAIMNTPASVDHSDLRTALEELREVDSLAAKIASLRLFDGKTFREIAAQIDIPRSTAQDNWKFARAWLGRRLKTQ